MWRPSQKQWWVIWATVIPASLLWVQDRWGREGGATRLAISLVVIGALIVWKLSQPEGGNRS